MNDITKSQRWDYLTRPSVKELDERPGVPTPCLDHGFIPRSYKEDAQDGN